MSIKGLPVFPTNLKKHLNLTILNILLHQLQAIGTNIWFPLAFKKAHLGQINIKLLLYLKQKEALEYQTQPIKLNDFALNHMGAYLSDKLKRIIKTMEIL